MKKTMHVVAPAVALCLTLLALTSVPTQAQSFTGSISGTVSDPSGAVVNNATVTLTALATGQTRTVTTNHAGEYNFPSLPPGEYKIHIAASGFTTGEISARLAVAQQLRADAQLRVGAETETVNISAGEGEVTTDRQNAELSTLVTGRQITELPLITRNPYDLITLSGGATDGPDRGSGNQRGAGFAVNGQRSQSANFMLDGGENNDTFTSMPGQTVPLDAIQEFRVQTSDFTAEFGRGAGYVANVVTRSGSNSFHGSAYEFNRNSALAANDSFSNANGFPKEFFNRNQFGFSAGGPVIKDKTFFFGSAEWLKVRSSVNSGFFVPTPQLLALTSAATQSIFTQFAAPAITGRTVTAASLGFNNLIDAGGNPVDPNTPLFGRVTTTVPRDAGAGSPQNTALWTLRLDHNFSNRTSLFGRYAYDREEALTGSNSFSPYQGFETDSKNRNQNLTLQLTHTWSPSVVTESRFVYNRLLNEQPLGSAPVTPTFLISDVISRQTDGDTVLPGYFATAGTLGNAIPFGGPQNLCQWYSSLSYQRGSHELKFGAQYLQIRDNRTFGAFENAIADFVSLVMPLALAASAAFAQAQRKPLDEKDNPELIGKRDINKGQIDFYSLDKEAALGRQLAAEVDRDSKFVTDPLVTEYVNRVGQNIALHSDAKTPFTIKVIDSNEINAFALPGGFLYVNRGVIEAADNEAELAGVMAHEIGHVAARHGVEQASKANLINYASLPLIFLGGWGGFAIRQAAGLAIPLSFLKFSRGMESEADRLGAQYLWASGYDPNAMVSFFEKLQAREKKKPGAIAKVFSTHPMTGDRITEVQKLVARFPDRQEYAINTSEFGAVKSRLVSINTAHNATDGPNKRPTLKRRPASTPSSTEDDGAPGRPQSKRPTLNRGDSTPDDEGAGDSQQTTERPVLKRRND